MHKLSADGVTMIVLLALARGVGELRLTSADPLVQPRLEYRFLQEPVDRERLRHGVRLAIQLAEHPEFKEIVRERVSPSGAALTSDDALDDWLLREVTTGHHISGTCKMGQVSDPLAVVDQCGRVHGVEGLRVADASIMPDCVRATINATVIMIGERVADVVMQEHQA